MTLVIGILLGLLPYVSSGAALSAGAAGAALHSADGGTNEMSEEATGDHRSNVQQPHTAVVAADGATALQLDDDGGASVHFDDTGEHSAKEVQPHRAAVHGDGSTVHVDARDSETSSRGAESHIAAVIKAAVSAAVDAALETTNPEVTHADVSKTIMVANTSVDCEKEAGKLTERSIGEIWDGCQQGCCAAAVRRAKALEKEFRSRENYIAYSICRSASGSQSKVFPKYTKEFLNLTWTFSRSTSRYTRLFVAVSCVWAGGRYGNISSDLVPVMLKINSTDIPSEYSHAVRLLCMFNHTLCPKLFPKLRALIRSDGTFRQLRGPVYAVGYICNIHPALCDALLPSIAKLNDHPLWKVRKYTAEVVWGRACAQGFQVSPDPLYVSPTCRRHYLLSRCNLTKEGVKDEEELERRLKTLQTYASMCKTIVTKHLIAKNETLRAQREANESKVAKEEAIIAKEEAIIAGNKSRALAIKAQVEKENAKKSLMKAKREEARAKRAEKDALRHLKAAEIQKVRTEAAQIVARERTRSSLKAETKFLHAKSELRADAAIKEQERERKEALKERDEAVKEESTQKWKAAIGIALALVPFFGKLAIDWFRAPAAANNVAAAANNVAAAANNAAAEDNGAEGAVDAADT